MVVAVAAEAMAEPDTADKKVCSGEQRRMPGGMRPKNAGDLVAGDIKKQPT